MTRSRYLARRYRPRCARSRRKRREDPSSWWRPRRRCSQARSWRGNAERRRCSARRVACRRDEGDARVAAGLDRVVKALCVAATAPARADDVRAVEAGVVHRADRVRGGAAVGTEETDGHEFHVPRHPCESLAVADARADRACAVRAVPAGVHRVVVVLIRVKAVAAVRRVRPHVFREIVVVVLDAGVGHGDDDGGRVPADRPAFRCIDVRVCAGVRTGARVVEAHILPCE